MLLCSKNLLDTRWRTLTELEKLIIYVAKAIPKTLPYRKAKDITLNLDSTRKVILIYRKSRSPLIHYPFDKTFLTDAIED